MLIRELIEILNKEIPEIDQENWDNSGSQLGNKDNEIKGIILCMDILDETIDYAIENDCNLIISHHPFFFNNIKSLTNDSIKGEKAYKLIKNDIYVYSLHTSFDLYKEGVSIQLGKALELEAISTLEENNDLAYGMVSKISPVKAKDFAIKMKDILALDNIICYGNLDKEVSLIGLMGGSGSSFVKKAIDLNLDMYISGDIKYHDYLDAIENGLVVLDIGHFSSEFPGLYKLKEIIEENGDFNILIYKPDDKYGRKII